MRAIHEGTASPYGGRAFAVWAAILTLPGLLACTGTSRTEADAPVTVFAAASTTEAMEAIGAAFEQETGIPVRLNLAGSSTLAAQIAAGAEADAFLSASGDWADYLEKRNLSARRLELLGNRLVVVAPKASQTNPRTPEDLLSPAVGHIAIGDPASVPAGQYARRAFERLGLWKRLQPKLVPATDVRVTLMMVERGEAEAGIVYATDGAASNAVRVAFELDPQLTGPIRYPLVLTRQGAASARATRFVAYLSSPRAREIFRARGFEVVGETP